MAATPREPSDAPVVAIDATPTLFPPTGIPRAVAETIRALRADGGVGLAPYAIGLRGPLHRRSAPAGTRFLPAPTHLLLRLWARAEHPRLDPVLRGAGVLHTTNFVTPPSRLPTVVTVHDCAFALHPETVTPVVRLFGDVLRRAVVRGATIHTPTEAVADDVERLFGPGLRAAGRLIAIPWGLTPIPPAGPSPVSGDYVLSIGTIDPRKNLDVLVAAFAQVAAGHRGLRLVLAGADGMGTPALGAAIDALPLDVRQRVIRLGTVTETDRVALLRGAAVLAYPSRYEGFGLPVLEAMSVGVPVVAGANPAVAEVGGGAVLLADPTDPGALATMIERAVAGSVDRTRMIEDGRTRAAQFTWPSTAARLVRLYRALAASSS